MSQKMLTFPTVNCTVSPCRIRCCQFRCILSGALRFYNLYVVYWWLTVSLAVCECVRVCVCVRCAECESAWHYCLYCKSCCNFVKISTLLVCPPARWSLSSVQQCHICAPQCLAPLCPSTSRSPFWTVAMQQICRRFQPLLVAFFC